MGALIPRSNDCASCKDDRHKKGLAPMVKVRLPNGITDERNFRRPSVPTWVCPYCDGETLINSAIRHYEKRKGSEKGD